MEVGRVSFTGREEKGARKRRLRKSVACRLGNVVSSEQSPHWEGSSLCPCSVTAPIRVHVRHYVAGCLGHWAGYQGWGICPLLCTTHLSLLIALVGPSYLWPLSLLISHLQIQVRLWCMSQGPWAHTVFSLHDSSWLPLLGMATFL